VEEEETEVKADDGRIIAIGDIHGCSRALRELLAAIELQTDDTLIFLGDYIDRGPNSRDVLEQIILLKEQCHLVTILGNHEEKLLEALHDVSNLRLWLELGGIDTLRSYGWEKWSQKRSLAEWLPTDHRQFIQHCLPYFETDTHLFMHAGYVPELAMEAQPALALRWRAIDAESARPHDSGKIAIVGHTPQLSGEILDLGFLICIDTNCARGGWLTALDVCSGKHWQANQQGKIRSKTLALREINKSID
jgi:serine/threonine protein phosphatase 1